MFSLYILILTNNKYLLKITFFFNYYKLIYVFFLKKYNLILIKL